MWSAVTVGPEPAVEGGGAFSSLGDGAEVGGVLAGRRPNVIDELVTINPDSHHLRYDRGTDGYPRPVAEELSRVDTSRVRETMDKVFGLLQGAADGLSEMNAGRRQREALSGCAR